MPDQTRPPLQMDELEIVNSYRTAKDQKKQLQVLAELNAVSIAFIADILTANGEKVDKRWLPRAKKSKPEDAPAQTPASAAMSAETLTELFSSLDAGVKVLCNGLPLTGYRYTEAYNAASDLVEKTVELF